MLFYGSPWLKKKNLLSSGQYRVVSVEFARAPEMHQSCHTHSTGVHHSPRAVSSRGRGWLLHVALTLFRSLLRNSHSGYELQIFINLRAEKNLVINFKRVEESGGIVFTH